MGMDTTRGLGSQNSIKKLARYVDHLGLPLSRNHVFKIFSYLIMAAWKIINYIIL